MAYRIVVISSPSKLSVKNNQLIVSGEKEGTVAVEDMRALIIESQMASVSSYTFSFLSEKGVPVIVCDDKHMPCGILQPFGQFSRQRRVLFFQLQQSLPLKKQIWKRIVFAKIMNQAKCLDLCNKNNVANILKDMASNLQAGDPNNIEGQAAACYFRELFGSTFSRSQENTINACLNYGYSVIRAYIARELASYGFEPCLGIHHASELNNFNLADDLIEPYRALVDLFVFKELLSDGGFSKEQRTRLLLLLNYEVISGEEKHSVAFSIERLIQSLKRCSSLKQCDELLLPSFDSLILHEYE